MGLTKPRAAQIYNLDYKQATRVVAVANVTLSGGAPAAVDGVSLSLNDRVLVTAQGTGSQNGIYYVSTVGSGSNGTWILASDDNTTGEIDAGMIVMVTEGAIYADTQWKLITDNPIIIGTTALTFTQNYLANAIIAGTSNVSVTSNANVNISSAGTANVLTISSTGTVVKGTESVTGNITSGNILTGGLISATGNIITAGNFVGNGAALTGITASAGAAITNGTSNVTVASSANTTVGVAGTTVSTFASTGLYLPGIVSAIGNITGNVFIGNGSQLTGIAAGSTYSNSNVTSLLASFGSNTISTTGSITSASLVGGVITGSSVSVTGIVTGTSHVGSVVSVTGAITGASVVGGVITGTSTSVTGTATAASTVGGVITGTSTSVTGTQTAASTVGGVITGSSASVTGTVTGGALTGSSLTVTTGSVTAGSIVNGNANGVGNIGSSTTYFNTVFAKATSAQYADLAEMYCGDKLYSPGTVVDFGGTNEITTTTKSHSTQVAGIISTNPSYLMNSALDCTTALEVALVGRVPCSVVGTIHKGDRLVSSDFPGVAQALDMSQYQPGCIVAKALEDYNSTEPGIIEVAVGRT